jgi:hypothetical protein
MFGCGARMEPLAPCVAWGWSVQSFHRGLGRGTGSQSQKSASVWNCSSTFERGGDPRGSLEGSRERRNLDPGGCLTDNERRPASSYCYRSGPLGEYGAFLRHHHCAVKLATGLAQSVWCGNQTQATARLSQYFHTLKTRSSGCLTGLVIMSSTIPSRGAMICSTVCPCKSRISPRTSP